MLLEWINRRRVLRAATIYASTLYAMCCTTSVSYSNFTGVSVRTDPTKFVNILVSEKLIERVFVYCLDDIRYFVDFDSTNCKYTRERLNSVLDTYQMGSIKEGERDIFVGVLMQIESALKQGRGK
jgi:hypothetical protein